jgi:hypothetical protein
MVYNDLTRLVQEERHRGRAESRHSDRTALSAANDRVIRIAKPFKPMADVSPQLRVRAAQLAA